MILSLEHIYKDYNMGRLSVPALKSGLAIMDLFQKLNDKGVTVIMITHDRNIAEHARCIVEIFDGELTEHPRE